VVCGLCHHRCHIALDQRGICGVRQNKEGSLYSLVYGRVVAEHIDPIEKKPLFHFLPGSKSYSIATVGCNFQCLHCQNYHISQYPIRHAGEITGNIREPKMVVDLALQTGCASISYTYVEPTIFYEFAYDCACLARDHGLKNVFVSNGYMTSEVVRHLAPVIDAINIDFKSFSSEFYHKICKARVEPVLENIRLFHELGVWVEVTTLIIPGLNDGEDELRDIARFIKSVSGDIPWHVTGFYPTHKMTDKPPTPPSSLEMARAIGLSEGLSFVYAGNDAVIGGEDTTCPGCGTLLVRRFRFSGEQTAMAGGSCSVCNLPIAGVWRAS